MMQTIGGTFRRIPSTAPAYSVYSRELTDGLEAILYTTNNEDWRIELYLKLDVGTIPPPIPSEYSLERGKKTEPNYQGGHVPLHEMGAPPNGLIWRDPNNSSPNEAVAKMQAWLKTFIAMGQVAHRSLDRLQGGVQDWTQLLGSVA